MEKPALIREIEGIANVSLHPAFGMGYDPALAVMPFHEQKPNRYLLNEEGVLIGLNLAGAKLEDGQWQQIASLSGFKPELLEALNLRENKLRKSPVSPQMKALKHLDLCDNKIQELEPPSPLLEHVLLYGNEMTSPPLEIVQQGKDAVLNYFSRLRETGVSKIYEAKVLIVGSGGAGKTTLLRRLLYNEKAVMPTEAESTHGIEVHDMQPFDCGGEHPFNAHLWDFGGQEIYHATHQFFLTKRSLYLLVSDARKEDDGFEYWLQIIQLLGADSPIIIVQNEKGGRHRDINLSGLQAQFANVKSLHSLDLGLTHNDPGNAQKLEALVQDIQQQLGKLPHIGDTLPNSWAKVRQELETERKSNQFISAEKFIQICDKHGEKGDEALRLSQYLHDLGFLLHFQDDPILKHTVILNNSWATEGVYAVLDSQPVKQLQKGKFSRANAVSVWDAKELEKGENIFKGKHDELLQLMLKFEICYRLPELPDDYIAPQLLPATEPEKSLQWPQDESLHLIFRYGFMPKGLMSRLIVRLNHYIKDHKEEAWQTGAILHRGDHTEARMLETYATGDIHLSARGRDAKDMITIASEEIERLNSSYEKIKVEKLVPCICSECRVNLKDKDWQKEDTVTLFDFKVLEKARSKSVKTLQCQNSFEQVNVLRLIDSVLETNFFRPKALKVFISYSKADDGHLQNLKNHLSPLVRDGMIRAWDDKDLLPGEEWDKSIRQQLSTADVIILLVSSDFLATEYIWQEIGIAIERHELAEALVVPVIVRPCAWTDAPFARFNALPEKGKPITKWDDADEAWQAVVERIKLLSKKLSH